MDITQFVEELRRDLNVAAQTGGDEIRAAAERLSTTLDSSVRLTLMDALSQAASEITTELNGTSVEVRLKGREPIFVVMGKATEAEPEPAEEPADDEEDLGFDDDDTVARITLRLPESLKTRAEELAARRGQSLNTWLVNATRAAASNRITINVNAPGMGPGAPGRNRSSNKRIQGWVR